MSSMVIIIGSRDINVTLAALGVSSRVMKGCVYPVLNWSHFCFILVLERKHLSNWIEPIATGFSCTVKELD
ncbi:MAG: hypothetical protein C5S47_07090 [Candidatus Methanogasteraceae archaeon]|nr:MAG: hypothetical protein C5S47_07090 [ANME-2 cluster archaeon]